MSKHVNFDHVTPRQGTYCTQWDFTDSRFGEKNLLPFSVSDMDIPTSPEIISAFKKRVDHGIFGYTRWNHSDYKKAITNWYKNRFSAAVNDDWIVYSPGVLYSIIKMLDLINPLRKCVSLMIPCYDNFPKILKSNDHPILTIQQSISQGKYTIDWNNLEQIISQSKVLLLCNPNNPDGKLWSKEELSRIVRICKQYNVFVISDDIHMDFVYHPDIFIPITEVAAEYDYLDHIMIATSSSKTFNLSGLGGSYVLIPNKELREKFAIQIQENDNLSTAMTLHVLGLITGYNESSYWIDTLTAYLRKNLEYTLSFLEQHLPKITMTLPQGTYFAWLDCSQLDMTSQIIQKKLITKGKLGIMDGERYLSPFPSLRMLICCPQSKLKEGLEKIVLSFLD